MSNTARWQFWIDRGGTFTDCIGAPPDGGPLRVTKVLSSDDAPVQGIRKLLELDDASPIPACDVRMGTTIGTNALLERRGVPTVLVVTEGFENLLEIGDQTRPDLFDLAIDRRAPLHTAVVTTCARVDARGRVLAEADLEALRAPLQAQLDDDVRSAAVLVLNAHANGSPERQIAAFARDLGFDDVVCSSEVAHEIGVLGRGDTAVVDAYLTPLLASYVAHLERRMPDARISVMQSGGTLTPAPRFRGRDSVLSGPAGGVVSCGAIARACGLAQVVGFDMGGTSTDVCRWAGAPARVYESEVAGVRLRTPMMDIHTVAAGGGSLCRLHAGRLTVGPESAGATPGPMCYGRAEARELALTDINVVLGRIVDDRFPFPLHGERPLSALEALVDQLRRDGDVPAEEQLDAHRLAWGFFEVAVESMTEAIRRVSVSRGHDVRDHGLIIFGGAGGQHACAVAERLGVSRLIFHPLSGVLSAWGMGVADVGWHGERDLGRPDLADGLVQANRAWDELEGEGRECLAHDGYATETLIVHRRIALRYRGTETSLTLDVERGTDDPRRLRSRFEREHERAFGYARATHVVEIALARAEVIAPGGAIERGSDIRSETLASSDTATTREVWLDASGTTQVPLLQREQLPVSEPVPGPALILEATGTIVLDRGWQATLRPDGIVMCSRTDAAAPSMSRAEPARDQADPVLLEVFNNRFMSIAEQMGEVLRRTAMSTNVRDRLDFSCAVFDAAGGLVANAPHIPVHLGAMSESVRAVAAAHPHPLPGDAFVTNDPAGGGSHLPDITVVSPVHDAAGQLRFFVASRGHHADVGGIEPGSMPPFSRSLADEGVVFRAEPIVREGQFLREEIRARLLEGPHPARDPDQNLADLEAQLAANRTGRRLLDELTSQYGLAVVEAYMGHVQANARRQVEQLLERIGPGERHFEDALDDGTPIVVHIEVTEGRMLVDFAGTGKQLPGNLNAPRAVTVAAVLYVLRSMIHEPIPLNGGCLAPIDIQIPPGCLLDPCPDAAVAGGNVETAQRVVDVLLGALGAAAASQGSMNNLTFGTESWGYYETIGGGSGAGPGFDGTSGVHTHMTNTRITDAEVLEARYPVRVHRFSLRPDSGGAGLHPGGAGLIREMEFLEPVRLSILSERRTRAPFGLHGGHHGQPGANLIIEGGHVRAVEGKVSLELPAGARVRLETPGGGGYGDPSQ